MPDLERLHRLLGGPALAGLRARLRRRYELGGEGGTVTLSGLDEAERAALCGLLGRPPSRGGSLRFDLAQLDAVLANADAAGSLREALALIDGPIANRAAQREASAQAWTKVAASVSDPRLAAWLAQPRALGLLKRACGSDPARAVQVCALVARVLAALPCNGTTRSQLAAQVLGDAHALDTGLAVPALVLAVLRHARGAATEETEDESARAQWAACGVLVNELARPVLVLNLPGFGQAGDPGYLSLRSLVRHEWAWGLARRDVFVCENPNVVAIAADSLGEYCSPLVCTDGMPAAAQRTLLSQLAAAGGQLRYHGDFDWPGVVIGNVLMNELGATSWRFDTPDYRAAVAAAAPSARPLEGGPGKDASWDCALGPAMRELGVAVDEEAVVAHLLTDLDRREPA